MLATAEKPVSPMSWTVHKFGGTSVADAGPGFAGHRWCDADPWVYGTSILVTNSSSTAPFHPTPAGQRAIAAAVLETLRHERGSTGPV